jgi:hypothetical protein
MMTRKHKLGRKEVSALCNVWIYFLCVFILHADNLGGRSLKTSRIYHNVNISSVA